MEKVIKKGSLRLLIQDGTELELVSRILGHFSTETTRIYEVPSIDMMRKVMESGNLESDEKPLWTDDEAAPEISPIISTP